MLRKPCVFDEDSLSDAANSNSHFRLSSPRDLQLMFPMFTFSKSADWSVGAAFIKFDAKNGVRLKTQGYKTKVYFLGEVL